jgi:hypothetical protein
MRSEKAFVICCLCSFLSITTYSFADWPNLRHRDTARQVELRPRLDQIRQEHPRIFCRAGDFEEIRQRAEATPEIREVYGWLLEWARGDHFYRNLWATPNQLMAVCVAYRLAPEEPILNHAISIADYLAEAQGDSWTWPRVAKGLAFAFDWLYDDLTPEQRQRYGEASLHAAKECYKTWRHSDFNNHQYLEYGPVLYTGIALWREGIDDATAEQLALDGLNMLVDHLMPAHEVVGQGDGGWHESMSYHAFFTYEFAHLIEFWTSASRGAECEERKEYRSGEDLWTDYTGLDGEAAWHVHCNRPFDEKRVSVADIGGRDAFGSANAQYLVLLQRRRRDGLARYWTDRIKEEAIRRRAAGVNYARAGGDWWPYILWYDPDVLAIQREELPPSRFFSGLGWVTMRSNWTPDATFALFVCAPLWLGGHQHADNNSFIIHKGGLLALDSGVYEGTPHRANYYARTIAHNTVTILDPNEQFNGGTWGSGRPGEGSNDGGQLFTSGPERVSDVTPGDEYHRGKILAYESNDVFTYVVGDATRSYSPEKLREFTRAFLYLRPNVFVIFDRVEATQGDFVKTWLLHSAQEPELSEKTARISNGEGQLQMWTLWPVQPEITKIGGSGHEFEVNGRNYPPTDKKNYDADEAGRWRIEVRSAEVTERQYFLHVLVTTDADAQYGENPPYPWRKVGQSVELLQAEGQLGAVIRNSDGVAKVLFTTEGVLTGTLELSDTTGSVRYHRLGIMGAGK